MHILLCNDDGYFSPGLSALADKLSDLGRVTVVAPEGDRSGASNSLTLDRPLWVRQAQSGYFYVNGTPTDCVHIAMTGLLDEKPDLVVSGINDGANLGDDTIYSGTVAAATEGHLMGVPGLALSIVKAGYAHLDSAVRVAHSLVEQMIANPPAPGTLLNVNIPSLPYPQLQGVKATRLGKRNTPEPVVQVENPRGKTIYWIGAAGSAREAGPGTDFHAVENGWVSVTPLQVDLSADQQVKRTEQWLPTLN
jgi:5'-nucleotidase